MKILEPSSLGRGVRLVSLGAALGARCVTNDDLSALGYPEADAFVTRATGISERRHADDHETTTSLAADACRQAMRRADLAQVDLLIVSSSSAERIIPTVGSSVHRELGLEGAPAHSISATCSGFLFGVEVAARAVLTGLDPVMVCASELRSRQVDPTDRATGALFGDAAGAAIFASCPPGEGLIAVGTTSIAAGADSVSLGRAREDRLVMANGPQVYFEAVEGMARVTRDILAALDLTLDDVALVIPHQANGRILKRFCWMAELPEERAFSNLERVGNTSSASIPVAMEEAARTGRLSPGDLVLWLAIGAGYTAGAALVRVDAPLLELTRGTR